MSNEKKSKTLTKKEFDDFFNDLHEKINEKKKLLSLKKKKYSNLLMKMKDLYILLKI